MSDLFDGLRNVTQTVRLADPADLRRTAGRRTTVLRRFVTAAVALVLAAGGLGAYGSGVFDRAPVGIAPTIGASPDAIATPSISPTPPVSTAPSSAPVVSSSTASGGLPARAAGDDCRPADLDPRPYYRTEGAAGTVYQDIYVQNVSSTRCRLYGHPTILFTDAGSGPGGVVPTRREFTATPVMLAPGGWARVTVSTANGNPFGPGAPQCAAPHSYAGLSLVIGDELPYPLPGLRLAWECADASLGPWMPDTQPVPDGRMLTRAPADQPE